MEEANALNYANALKNLSKALELEAKSQKNKVKSGLSLFEKLQNQVKAPELPYDILPETWKLENVFHEQVESSKKVKKSVANQAVEEKKKKSPK